MGCRHLRLGVDALHASFGLRVYIPRGRGVGSAIWNWRIKFVVWQVGFRLRIFCFCAWGVGFGIEVLDSNSRGLGMGFQVKG